MTRPLRILSADDKAMLGETLFHLFSRWGHLIERVEDGLAAWERISCDLGGFDVVITDHEMPGLTGLGLVELLRQAGYAGRIVVYSASLSVAEAKAYRGFGVAAIVMKSSGTRVLLTAVEIESRRL